MLDTPDFSAALDPAFLAAIAAAEKVVDRGPVAAATALRSAGVDPTLAAAALTQATLRRLT